MSYLGLKDVLGLRMSQDLAKRRLRLPVPDLNPVMVCEDFFCQTLSARLAGFSDKLHQPSWRGISTIFQLGFGEYKLRLDRELVLHLLSETFGPQESDPTDFHCHRMSDLEVQVIEACVQGIITQTSEVLSALVPDIQPEEPQVYLIWLILLKDKVGKIALSLPQSLFYDQSPPPQASQGAFFLEAYSSCKLGVGTTMLSLANVLRLEEGDFLLLESSDSKFLDLKGINSKGYKLPVSYSAPHKNAKWHKIKLSEIDTTEREELSVMEGDTRSELLNDFPVELRAEFQAVSLTFRELVELQEGSVLPLDKVTESELLLMSKDKPIARGELVVVGDKFGILIKKVLLGGE